MKTRAKNTKVTEAMQGSRLQRFLVNELEELDNMLEKEQHTEQNNDHDDMVQRKNEQNGNEDDPVLSPFTNTILAAKSLTKAMSINTAKPRRTATRSRMPKTQSVRLSPARTHSPLSSSSIRRKNSSKCSTKDSDMLTNKPENTRTETKRIKSNHPRSERRLKPTRPPKSSSSSSRRTNKEDKTESSSLTSSSSSSKLNNHRQQTSSLRPEEGSGSVKPNSDRLSSSSHRRRRRHVGRNNPSKQKKSISEFSKSEKNAFLTAYSTTTMKKPVSATSISTTGTINSSERNNERERQSSSQGTLEKGRKRRDKNDIINVPETPRTFALQRANFNKNMFKSMRMLVGPRSTSARKPLLVDDEDNNESLDGDSPFAIDQEKNNNKIKDKRTIEKNNKETYDQVGTLTEAAENKTSSTTKVATGSSDEVKGKGHKHYETDHKQKKKIWSSKFIKKALAKQVEKRKAAAAEQYGLMMSFTNFSNSATDNLMEDFEGGEVVNSKEHKKKRVSEDNVECINVAQKVEQSVQNKKNSKMGQFSLLPKPECVFKMNKQNHITTTTTERVTTISEGLLGKEAEDEILSTASFSTTDDDEEYIFPLSEDDLFANMEADEEIQQGNQEEDDSLMMSNLFASFSIDDMMRMSSSTSLGLVRYSNHSHDSTINSNSNHHHQHDSSTTIHTTTSTVKGLQIDFSRMKNRGNGDLFAVKTKVSSKNPKNSSSISKKSVPVPALDGDNSYASSSSARAA